MIVVRTAIDWDMLRALNVFRVVEIEGRGDTRMLLSDFRACANRLQFRFIARFGIGSWAWQSSEWFSITTFSQFF